MFSHGLDRVEPPIADLVRQSGALGEELHFLHHPAIAVREVLGPADHSAVRVAFLSYDRDRFATDAPRPDKLSSLGLRSRLPHRPFEILAPKRSLAPICQQLDIVRARLPLSKLVGRPAMRGQPPDDQSIVALSSTTGSGAGNAAARKPSPSGE